jgi:hypothetical protein
VVPQDLGRWLQDARGAWLQDRPCVAAARSTSAGRAFFQGSRQEHRDASVNNRLPSNLVTPLIVESQ